MAKNVYICANVFGGLAQLARAFDWQSKGHRFDSGNLHLKIKALQNTVRLFKFHLHTICIQLGKFLLKWSVRFWDIQI